MKNAIVLLCALALLSLAYATGSLAISSNPSGAEIFSFAGVSYGTTPTTLNLTAGTHSFVLLKPGYEAARFATQINEGRADNVGVNLRQSQNNNGHLRITTDPAGATPTIDAMTYGATPNLITNLSAGVHQVRITKRGYETYFANVTISAGRISDINVALSEAGQNVRQRTGSLRIESSPSRANAFVDGTQKGATPLTVSNLTAGAHRVLLTRAGYENYTENVQIRAGETAIINATLERIRQAPQVGNLTITSSPDGASVYIGGRNYGTTPATLQLTPAKYTVELRKDGYTTTTRSVSVYNGRTATISATMYRPQQPADKTSPTTSIPSSTIANSSSNKSTNATNTTSRTVTKKVKVMKSLTPEEQKSYNDAVLRLNTLGIGFDISKYEQEVEVKFNTK